jgi:hypothetical protein
LALKSKGIKINITKESKLYEWKRYETNVYNNGYG